MSTRAALPQSPEDKARLPQLPCASTEGSCRLGDISLNHLQIATVPRGTSVLERNHCYLGWHFSWNPAEVSRTDSFLFKGLEGMVTQFFLRAAQKYHIISLVFLWNRIRRWCTCLPQETGILAVVYGALGPAPKLLLSSFLHHGSMDRGFQAVRATFLHRKQKNVFRLMVITKWLPIQSRALQNNELEVMLDCILHLD